MHANHLLSRRLALFGLTFAAAASALALSRASAQASTTELAEKLTPAQLEAYEAYRTVRDQFERQLKTYWRRVEAKRDARRAKRILGQAYEPEDYIATQPP